MSQGSLVRNRNYTDIGGDRVILSVQLVAAVGSVDDIADRRLEKQRILE